MSLLNRRTFNKLLLPILSLGLIKNKCRLHYYDLVQHSDDLWKCSNCGDVKTFEQLIPKPNNFKNIARKFT